METPPKTTDEGILSQIPAARQAELRELGSKVSSIIQQAFESPSEQQAFFANPHAYLTTNGANIPVEEADYNARFNSARLSEIGGELDLSNPCTICYYTSVSVILTFVAAYAVIEWYFAGSIAVALVALPLFAAFSVVVVVGIILGLTAYYAANALCQEGGYCPSQLVPEISGG